MVLNNKQQMHNTLIAQSCCLFWDQSVLTEKVSVLAQSSLTVTFTVIWEQIFYSGILPWKDEF